MKIANSFWLNLANQTDENGKSLQEVFNNMATDSRYSGEDIVSYFNIEKFNSDLAKSIIDSYKMSAEVIRSRIKNNISKASSKLKNQGNFTVLENYINEYAG